MATPYVLLLLQGAVWAAGAQVFRCSGGQGGKGACPSLGQKGLNDLFPTTQYKHAAPWRLVTKYSFAMLYSLRPDPSLPADVGLFLETLEDSTREWRGELGEVPIEAIVWQPFPGSHSIGGILLHIAEVEDHWINEMCLGEPTPAELTAELLGDQTLVDDVSWPTPPAKPLSWYYEKLDEVRARTREAVRRMPPTDKVVKRPHWDFEVTLQWILGHVVGHDSYHGGQAVLLKLLWERK